ncbi:MAG: hypothetical protein N3A71_02420 [Candidatus Dojkabacteria bacterium]|nr:hypothetical protein [Candidatus Dojkabacteria bacterium]
MAVDEIEVSYKNQIRCAIKLGKSSDVCQPQLGPTFYETLASLCAELIHWSRIGRQNNNV